VIGDSSRSGRPVDRVGRIHIVALLPLLSAVLTLTACGGRESALEEAPETAATTTVGRSTVPERSVAPAHPPERVPSPSEPPRLTGEVPVALLVEIVADAAERLGAAIVDVEVMQARAVTWPDGALGCPQPGIVYTQALVPGYWVVVEADERRLDYRVGRQGSFFVCEDATAAVPPGAGSDSGG
jgi:hypothetical protein